MKILKYHFRCYMECIFTLLMFAGFNLNVKAQTPNLISYQAVIRNASGALVSGKTVKARISILKDSANGTAVYTETHQVKTNANGLMSLQIGGGSVVSGNFNTIDWGKTYYFTKQEIDPDGGTNYTLRGVSQMLSVPYALHAKNAENCFQHYVGELYGGGIVFHVWKDTAGVEHGLVVNKNWLGIDSFGSPTVKWFNKDTIVGAFSPTDGLSNSKIITEAPGHNKSMAQFCLDLEENGFNDWYLPSIEELFLLMSNYIVINSSLLQFKGDPLYTNGQSTPIASSTEIDGLCSHSYVCYGYAIINTPLLHKNTTINQNDITSISNNISIYRSETHSLFHSFFRAIRKY